MRISAFIFDMDGIIFDTERLYYKFWKIVLNNYGYNLTEEIYKETIGVNIRETEKILKKYFGEDLPFHEIYQKVLSLTQDYIEKKGVPIKKGLFELISFLEEKKVTKGIATSTEKDKAYYLLRKAGILEKFEAIVCGDEVSKSKPEPDIFLEVAKKLSVNPSYCIVLEDSENGILGAYRANMIPFLVLDFKHPKKEIMNLAYKVFNSLIEVREYLKEIL